MRRFAVVLAVVAVLMMGVAPAASPAPSPQGTLTSAFSTWFTGGEATTVATFDRGGQAWFYSATNAFLFDTFDIPGQPNSGLGAVRLSPVPGWPAGPFCDSNTFGVWVVIFGTRDFVEAWPDQVLMVNGEELDSTQTPLERIADPLGFWEEDLGEKGWWFSFGVAVYGHLDPGVYDITLALSDGSSLTNTVEIVSCP